MVAQARLRKLIQEGKLAEDEGWQLLEAFEAAEARDRVVLEELRRVQAVRRSGRVWGSVSVGLLVMAMAYLSVATVIGSARAPSATLAPTLPQLVGEDLDRAIERLEQQVRRPATASDYRLLSVAYRQRFERTHIDADQQRAVQMWARAERLERRTAMAGRGVFGVIFVLVIVTAVALWVMAMYNGLAKSDEQVNVRWAQVEAVLQRRLDLIPQLVETVKGYVMHERETLVAITEARGKALGILQATGQTAPKSTKTMEELTAAMTALSNTSKSLFALVEQYPELKANTNFLTLQDQLEGTENRIAVERQRYNDAVRDYHARLRVFPSNVVAGMFGFEAREYFESKAAAQDAVPVSFK